MKKILILFLTGYATCSFGEGVTEFPGMCGVDGYTHFLAVPRSFTCASGYFLPANSTTFATCPTGYTCSGGTFTFNATNAQGIVRNSEYISPNETHTCASNLIGTMNAVFTLKTYECGLGYYLPANVDGCTICPANSYCAGGTFSFNETTDQGIIACASGTFAPTGSTVCYPHILHIGEDIVYARSTKKTTPSLNIQIGNDIFYINMTTTRTRMTKDSAHYFHAEWDNNDYYICDDTTYPQ